MPSYTTIGTGFPPPVGPQPAVAVVLTRAGPFAPSTPAKKRLWSIPYSTVTWPNAALSHPTISVMPPVATLTFCWAKILAMSAGSSASPSPAHDCAAARAAASEAFTIARRLNSSCPTSTVRTTRPSSANKLITTMTAVAPRSPSSVRREVRLIGSSLAAERSAQCRVHRDQRDEGDVDPKGLLHGAGEARIVDRDRDLLAEVRLGVVARPRPGEGPRAVERPDRGFFHRVPDGRVVAANGGDSGALAGRGTKVLHLPEGQAVLEQAEDEDRQQSHDQGELDRGRSFFSAKLASNAHVVSHSLKQSSAPRSAALSGASSGRRPLTATTRRR